MHFVARTIIVIQINMIINVLGFWPPPYKINLTDAEEFVIGDYVESNEDVYNLEDEMIQDTDVKSFHIDKERHKFERLHKQAKRFNDRQNENSLYSKNNNNYTFESNDTYFDEPEPWQAGFVDKDNNFIKNQDNTNVYYLNTITKQLVAEKINEKREEQKDKNYNYDELNNEYKMEVLKEQKLNETFDSSNNKNEDESVKEAIDEMVKFETPRNCTKEELNGIGFGAVKCVWLEIKKAEPQVSRWELFARIRRIFIIWFCVYLVIAIPCWCHKGWCCCCFRCKFCKPRKRIDETKKYFMDNPPGTYLTHDKKVVNYKPTVYETEAYAKLKRALMHL